VISTIVGCLAPAWAGRRVDADAAKVVQESGVFRGQNKLCKSSTINFGAEGKVLREKALIVNRRGDSFA
jgi:hypothetical protein